MWYRYPIDFKRLALTHLYIAIDRLITVFRKKLEHLELFQEYYRLDSVPESVQATLMMMMMMIATYTVSQEKFPSLNYL